MAEESSFENQRISNFLCLVTFTVDWVIWHIIVHYFTSITNFISIKKTFCRQMYVLTYRYRHRLYEVDCKEETTS